MISESTSSFYDKNAIQLTTQYDSLEFESVHQSWDTYWPESGRYVLDIGAGSGRDAKWFYEQGCFVVAVEPSDSMREQGIQNNPLEIKWLDDSLPNLNLVRSRARQYDLILLSAVWMHLPVEHRALALKVLSQLLLDSGKLVITLRYGDFTDERENFGVSISELAELSKATGFSICHVAGGEDALKRENVTWQTVVLEKNSALGFEG